MNYITKKTVLLDEVSACIKLYKIHELEDFMSEFSKRILNVKIKFPLLELAARLLYEEIDGDDQIELLNKISDLKTIGGNVIIGIILQMRRMMNFNESFHRAFIYISSAQQWYASDIIGERLIGVSLLNDTEKTINIFKKKIENNYDIWFIRSFGAGAHYAIKKGLIADKIFLLFPVLLSFKNEREQAIKQGIGWAAKTTAKFHPQIINKFQSDIYDGKTGKWFISKVKTGLERYEYAKRNLREVRTK